MTQPLYSQACSIALLAYSSAALFIDALAFSSASRRNRRSSLNLPSSLPIFLAMACSSGHSSLSYSSILFTYVQGVILGTASIGDGVVTCCGVTREGCGSRRSEILCLVGESGGDQLRRERGFRVRNDQVSIYYILLLTIALAIQTASPTQESFLFLVSLPQAFVGNPQVTHLPSIISLIFHSIPSDLRPFSHKRFKSFAPLNTYKLMKQDLLKLLSQILQKTPQTNDKQVTITNLDDITRHDKYYGKFRGQIDPRDQEIIQPFTFTLTSFNYTHTQVTETEEYKQIQREVHSFLSAMCENVVSISFKLLNQGKLTENQAKDFASKNILGNVECILTKILAGLRAILKNQEIQDFVNKLTQGIDETLMEVLKNLASYYPQAPAAGNTAKMREVIVNVNRSQDETTDLIYNCKIKIQPYIKRKSWDSGEILSSYEDYTGFIMEVINATISVTRESAIQRAEETVFQKFVEFSERLFCTTQSKYYKTVLSNTLKPKVVPQNGDDHLVKYYKKILEGEEIEIDENWAMPSLDAVRGFFSFLGPKKDIRQEEKQNKKLTTGEYMQLIKSQYPQQLQKMKKAARHAVGQKIPAYVKPFSRNDLKQTNFFVNNSAVLRIMTKWAQKLQEIFVKSELIIKQREYYFKNIKNQLVQPNETMKNMLNERLTKEYKVVKKEFEKLKEKNNLLQSYFLTQGKYDTQNSYLTRYTNTRCTASKINATLIESMRKYLCILIHHLLRAGSDMQVGSKKQHINLIVFQVNDLLRSKFQCNESTFINILNTLYLLDKSPQTRNKFKLVRLKNKLDQKDNNILINYMFLGKVQCELQLSIQEMKNKEKNYYNFSHFVYELTRGKFGAITECAIIVSQHDPIVNSSMTGMFYQPKKSSKLQKHKILQKNPIEFNKVTKKDSNLFVCANCKEFVINDNGELFQTKESVCNACIMRRPNPQTLIRNQTIKKYLSQHVNKTLKKINDFSEIQNNKFVITMPAKGKKHDTIKLFKAWYHPRQFKLFLIEINSSILARVDNVDKFQNQDFDYFDIQEELQRRKGVKELSYIIQENYVHEISELLGIEKEAFNSVPKLVERFQNFRIESNLLKAVRFKSEIIDLSGDRLKLAMFNVILVGSKGKTSKDGKRYKRYRNIELSNVKTINLDKLALQKVPIPLTELKNLTSLNIQDNKIKNIDITHIPTLTNLDISNNQITVIDLTKNSNLVSVDMGQNSIPAINLSRNYNLTYLDLRRNKISEISLYSCQLITYLNLSKNQLTEVDLRRNVLLNYVNLGSNHLQDVDLTCNGYLIELNIDHNQLQDINLSQNIQLTSLNLSNNAITSIDITKNTNLTNLILHSNRLQSIDLSQNPNLINLNLYKNQLSQINLTKNTYLTSINLYHNYLTEIDVSKNSSLCSLNLYKNRLIHVDVTRNYNLAQLDVSYNQLKAINISKNIDLVNIDLRNNQLIALDLSNLSQFFTVSLQFNKLTALTFSYSQDFNFNNIDFRNQLSEKCEVSVYHKKAEQAECQEAVRKFYSNLNYKKCRVLLIPKN